ncbi:MAG: rod shape-determining protein MreC [Candidatus Omnitrophota bacterium]
MLSKKRDLVFLSLAAAIILLAASVVPFLRSPLIDSLHWPLLIFSQISREVQGITLYHRNLIENRRLKKELALLRRKRFEAKELYLENIRLRKLLDFKEKSVYPLTAANVIGYEPSNLSSVITIDKGKRQGIVQGRAVITNDGLVGRVVESGGTTSKALLINDINSGVAALLQRSRQKGLVSGTLGGELILRYLPPGADVKISDLVITSGLSGLYPKGIIIGEVTQVREEEGRPEIFAVVRPSAKLTKLEEVLVVVEQ